ncbi:MAG: nitroreductase family protein [Synergistaceae bacterium]|jgi:nitroreductase|nr:nitroreductase family protein [Synergistaceae bacterium]
MEIKEAIFGRRSVRKFTSDPVSEQDIQDILTAGLAAPSAINLQPWFFVVVRDEEARKDLLNILGKGLPKNRAELSARFPKNPEVVEESLGFIGSLGNAPVCILAFLLKKDYEDRLSSMQSVAAAIENMLLMAYGKGLGSCWLTAPLQANLAPEVQARFAPDKGEFLAFIALGHPAQSPAMPRRKDERFVII